MAENLIYENASIAEYLVKLILYMHAYTVVQEQRRNVIWCYEILSDTSNYRAFENALDVSLVVCILHHRCNGTHLTVHTSTYIAFGF